MKILMCSRSFLPDIGGIAAASDSIARALSRRNQQVTIVTETPGEPESDAPYLVIRRPSPARLLAAVCACDVYLHNHVTLRAVWPLLLAPRPWVVVHQIYLRSKPSALTGSERLKRFSLRFARSVAISIAVARDLPCPAAIIPNGYRDDIFRVTNHGIRPVELAYLGRLVHDKGVPTLLKALKLLRQSSLAPRLRLIGAGPDEEALRREAQDLGILSQIEFAGLRRNEDLANLLNDCAILVVPSLWPEPFGIVALEGIACGCVVVGSALGGLPEAIGKCGMTFPNGDHVALAGTLAELLRSPDRTATLRAHASAHLARHTADAVAGKLLQIIEDECRSFRAYRHSPPAS